MTAAFRWLACLFVLSTCFLPAQAKERDPDLFNTFYLEGTKPTWILTIKPKNLYSLIGPDGTYYEGWYNSSDDEIGMHYGNNANEPYRHFEYKLSDGNLKLNPSKKDMLADGQAQGAMPPTKRGKTVKFISKQNWLADGKDEGPINAARLPVQAPVAQNTPPPVAQLPVIPIIPAETPTNNVPVIAPIPEVPTIPQNAPPVQVPAPAQPAVALQALAGRYEFKPSAAVIETLSLNGAGTFEYVDSQGSKASGTFNVESGLLVFKAGAEVRAFQFDVAAGLKLTRSAQDTPKFTNDLAYMSPSVGRTAQYVKQGGAGAAVANQPGLAPVVQAPAYDAEILKAVQVGQTQQALQQAQAALQANPKDQRLAQQKQDLESLLGVENLYGTLRSMYGQAQRSIDAVALANPQDEIAGKATTYFKEHAASCDAGIVKARGLFAAGQGAALMNSITDAKNLGEESAEAFEKLGLYYQQKTGTTQTAEVLKNLSEQATSLSKK